jgi:hypothetical protein
LAECRYSFSPQLLQWMESARFSEPHCGQDLFRGAVSVARPQREQNFAFGARFLLQREHWLNTTI